ncbi:MAG: hypothetical protein NVS2B14_14070 [Chamaesiphon sp.]
MLDSPHVQQNTYGLIVNGREFVFLKLIKHELPKYARSYALSIERPAEFYQVLSILKYLSQLLAS